ncbi:hypothetical protein DTO021D3_3847 [Paecilomyces variotii]|nr:hypothetical protein DTO032I3_7938 [Paecilomyces variotii]KAJ9279391.1 hypothetical protein DTO021D3_3847 [Paecilomyces variotii]KAJ9341236.1 hypothetical protein DTO027B6_6217 [Paecilomyces variotii]KAJ9349351.1 hypothetical protein DTO027B9_7625 [Paecilomyces variotii]KAJ9380559.1 hypothetical protein DTO032I4_6647 [Paecilomyces variotii]
MRIEFDDYPHPLILGQKILERKTQLDEMSWETDRVASQAWAIYVCENLNDPTDQAIMKIYMQIPYAGSEFDPPQLRASQALELQGFARSEYNALKLFTEKACPSTPKLLASKVDTQGPQDLVPGGFIVYLLMEKLPCCRLEDEVFWNLDESERADIRQKFKEAWISCYNAGLVLYLGNTDNILWDAATKRLYFTGFQYTCSSEEYAQGWDDKQLRLWFLSKPPKYLLKRPTRDPKPEDSLIALRDGSRRKISDVFGR